MGCIRAIANRQGIKTGSCSLRIGDLDPNRSGGGKQFRLERRGGEGTADNDHVSIQVGGLIIPGTGLIMSLLQLDNFHAFDPCVFNGIIG